MIRNFIQYIRGLPKKYSIGGAIAIVVIGAVGVHYITRAPALETTQTGISHVQIASVGSLSSQTGPLPVTGKVTSLSEATILAVSSGEIVSLSRAIGDHVSAGSVIAQFENSSQQAAVLQAQGAYEGAQAALAKASGTTAQNSSITSAQADTTVQNAKLSAQTALQSAYASIDDAVHAKADLLFSSPRAAQPILVQFTIPDSQIVITVQDERGKLEQTLSNAHTLLSSQGDPDANIAVMSGYAQEVATFLNDLNRAVSQAVPNQSVSAATIATDQAATAAARTEVVAALSSLTSAKSTYDAALASSQSAANSASGGSQNDINAAQANVKQALGALNAAKANLEKTIVRSPISGTIVSLPVTKGDYVPSFSTVAEVSNPGALFVDTHVTSGDAQTIAIGNKATIDANTTGVITFIAPALDPATGKIEVKIGLNSGEKALTDGETVTVALERTRTGTTNGNASKPGVPAGIVIPIASAKITPQGPVVFTVTASSTLVSHAIVFGPIRGNQVTVTSGLSFDMDIVTDARGLSDGQSVIVDAQ